MSQPAGSTYRCPNCATSVAGKFCPECGQPRDIHVRSVGEVWHDVTHTVTHVDSRAWQTLRLLVLRPGELTCEFFRGRLARYLPPFRLYLVLSVLYFAASAGLSSLDGEPPTPSVSVQPSASPAGPARCHLSLQLPGMGDISPRLNQACERVLADGGRHFKDVFRATAPKLMFALVPLVAAFALLLYWRPRRLYAEHLVFFLHGQALLFLVQTVLDLANSLGQRLPIAQPALAVVRVALAIYLCWYYYRAMRRFYGQGATRTLVKYGLLACTYLVLLGLTLLVGVVYTALHA